MRTRNGSAPEAKHRLRAFAGRAQRQARLRAREKERECDAADDREIGQRRQRRTAAARRPEYRRGRESARARSGVR